jgi:U3 small nucleolar RNA-associated protein 13
LFSIGQGRLLTSFSASSSMSNKIPAIQLSYNKSGSLLAVALGSSSIRIYSFKENRFITQLHNNSGKSQNSAQIHTGRISLMQFFDMEQHQNLIVSSALDGVKVWNIDNERGNQCIAWVNKNLGDVNTVAFSSSRNWLITGGDEIIKIYDINDKFKDLKTIPTGAIVAALALVSDNQLAVVSTESSNITIWNTESGEVEKVSTEASDDMSDNEEDKAEEKDGETEQEAEDGNSDKPGFFKLFQIHYSPVKQSFMCVTTDQNFLFYSWPELKRQRQIVGFNDEILDLTLLMNKTISTEANEDNRELIIATNSEKILRVKLQSKNVQFLCGHRDLVMGIALDTVHEKFLVSASKDKTVRVWNLKNNKCIAVGTAHSKSVTSIAFANTSKKPFFVTASDDKTVKLWDLSQFSNLKNDKQEFSEKNVVPIRPEKTVDAHAKLINQIALSPNDQYLATASSDKTVKIWDMATMECVRVIQHPKAVYSVAFSSLDKTIVTGCGDSIMRIYSLTNGNLLKIFAHDTSHSLLKVSFLRNGTQLVSIDAAGLLKLWSIKASACLGSFDQHSDRVWGLNISDKMNDQFLMITGGEDSRVNIWKDNTLEVIQEQKREIDETVKMDQELKNLAKEKKHLAAIKLAIQADRPRQVYTLIEQFLALETDSRKDNQTIADLIASLEYTQVMTLFQYTIDWNTNSRFCSVAQRILHAMFSNLDPSFINTPYEKSVNALLAYNEKHLKRVQNLLQRSYLLDYMLSNMKMVAPQSDQDLNVDTLLSSNAASQSKTSVLQKRKRVVDPELETEEAEQETIPDGKSNGTSETSEATKPKPTVEAPPEKKRKLSNTTEKPVEAAAPKKVAKVTVQKKKPAVSAKIAQQPKRNLKKKN